ncbi:MAG: alpha/beta hydrolase [Geminicoccaceae bacterium]|jgi:alpha-beta hydrolase superfamily lysophospholipase
MLSRILLAGLTLAVVGASMVKPKRRRSKRMGALQLNGDSVTVGDGAILPLMRWPTEGEPRAIMLGLHAYGDYRRAFRLAGPWFAEHGVELMAYDQRGFGETASRGVWPGADELIQDFGDTVAILRASFPDLPLYVIGESMGGAVALAGLASGEVVGVDRLIVGAPGVSGDMPLRQLHDSVLRLAALALPWLAIELRRGGRPWLDPSEAARLADDPLILRELSVGTYEGLIDLATIASDHLRGALPPTFLLYGELDGTIPRRAVDDLARALNDQDDFRYYPDRHHLLFHEADSDVVFADCLKWLRLID